MLSGIVLVDDFPLLLECTVALRPGRGEILVAGQLEPSIEEIINYGINFAGEVCDLEEKPFPDLSSHNLVIRLQTPGSAAPIVGRSYALLLCLGIVSAVVGKAPTLSACVTGEIARDGTVLDVGGIAEKRRGAVKLQSTHIVLPAGQLDFFHHDIIQIPVSTIFEAYAAVTYGQT